MLFWQINSFFHTQSSEKSFILLIAFSLLMEDRQKNCSKFLGTANYRSKNCGELMGGTNYHSKIPSKLSRTANYCSKICVDWDNRHHENMGKFPWNIVSSGISSKSKESQEFRWNSLALLLHKTVIWAHAAQKCSQRSVMWHHIWSSNPQDSRWVYWI